MIRAGKAVKGAKVLILGLTFKENVGDIRNTKVVDIISELAEYGVESFVYDPYASAEEVLHDKFKELAGFCRKGATPIVVDIKGMFEPEMAVKQGIRYWRL